MDQMRIAAAKEAQCAIDDPRLVFAGESVGTVYTSGRRDRTEWYDFHLAPNRTIKITVCWFNVGNEIKAHSEE